MQVGTFKLPTVGSIVTYRAQTKKAIGIVVCFEPNGMCKGTTRVKWNNGVCEWIRWTSLLEVICK